MSDGAGPPAVGRPSWFELTVPDPAVAASFYGALFGWHVPPDDPAYRKAFLRNQLVAAIRREDPDGGPAWLVHFAVDDLSATVAAVIAAGGQVLDQPHDRPAGRVAIVAEPTGGAFGLLEAGTFPGSVVLDEPGAVCWAEASSKDPSAAGAFFATVFGLEAKRPYPRYTYVQLRSAGRDVAGILGYSHERRPKAGPAAWLVYFQVSDTDAALRAVVDRGGRVLERAHDTAFGRFATAADPSGARFAVMTRKQ